MTLVPRNVLRNVRIATLALTAIATGVGENQRASRDRDTSSDHDANRDRDRFDNRQNSRDREVTRGELPSFDQFLGGHANIAKQLSKDPALANDQCFLQKHPDFQEYLKAHPQVQSQLTQDPHNFMKLAQQPATTGTVKSTTPETNPKQ
jgi:hypothetical protein